MELWFLSSLDRSISPAGHGVVQQVAWLGDGRKPGWGRWRPGVPDQPKKEGTMTREARYTRPEAQE